MDRHYDVIIIGSGLGGLVSANILAMEGYHVCVLEKNQQYGGNLQTFVRDKTIFDTGVHYLGGLAPGQNLYRYFSYLGIMDGLRLEPMDPQGFDRISFDGDPNHYLYGQGYDSFAKSLIAQFPEEVTAIRSYCQKMQWVCDQFPLYRLQLGQYQEDKELFTLGAMDFINSITDNPKLRAVLAGTNLLYAGNEKTPFYMHALSVNSYIESAFKCVNGGSQLSKLLIRKLRERGGAVYNHQEVTALEVVGQSVKSIITSQGHTLSADTFIANIDPKQLLRLTEEGTFKKHYTNRINRLPDTIAGFSLYMVLKPKCFPYFNHNYYHTKDPDRIWNAQDYSQESWPENYMLSMGHKKNQGEWGESLTAMTYMRFEEVAPWANTVNTVNQKNDRGETYMEFKTRKAEKLLVELEQKFPNIRACIHSMHTSTPLSYRDYIGNAKGALYGYAKDHTNPLQAMITPRTKLKNLLFTGQSLNMHGILGVTIGAVRTCSELLGHEYLLQKIIENTSATLKE